MRLSFFFHPLLPPPVARIPPREVLASEEHRCSSLGGQVLATSPSSLPVKRGGRRGNEGEVGGDGPK